MIQNRYKYDEIGYAEEILRCGFITSHVYTEMCILVLYYRDFMGYKPKQCKEALVKFCEERWPDYEPETHYVTINRALRAAEKHMRLVTVGYVNVFREDFEAIDSYDVSYDHKKLMFTILVSLRLDRYYRMLKFDREYKSNIFYGTDSVMRNIKKLACIPKAGDLNMTMIPDLIEAGAITPLHRGRLYLNFLDKCSQSGECVMEVTCYDDIGLYYDLHNKQKNVTLCEVCSKPFRKNSNRQMRCTDCRVKVNRERKNQYMLEYMRQYRTNRQAN